MKKKPSTYQGVPIKYKRDKGVRPVKIKRDQPKITPDIILTNTWYALRVAPQKEFATQELLGFRGIQTYVPVRKEWRFRNKYDKARKQKHLISFAEAVGYVFMAIPDGQFPNWFKIGQLATVTGVVGFEGEPKPLDRTGLLRLVHTFPNGIQRPAYEKFMQTGGEFKVGDTVRPLASAFQSHHIKVKEITGQGKVPLTIELFGKKHHLEFDAWDLELVEAAE